MNTNTTGWCQTDKQLMDGERCAIALPLGLKTDL